MNILFLTLVKINTLDERGIYTDLLRNFRDEGHNVSVVTPLERRENKPTQLVKESDVSILPSIYKDNDVFSSEMVPCDD